MVTCRASRGFVLALVASCLALGCATTRSEAASRVREADSNMVSPCKYLGEVTGTSGWGNLAASAGIENAKNEALQKAADMGATHVVWNNMNGGSAPSVSGKAYACSTSERI